MSYRDRLLELYRTQFSGLFKVRETQVNFIVYRTVNDEKQVVANFPKNDDTTEALHLAQLVVTTMANQMALTEVKKLDPDFSVDFQKPILIPGGNEDAYKEVGRPIDSQGSNRTGMTCQASNEIRTASNEYPLE